MAWPFSISPTAGLWWKKCNGKPALFAELERLKPRELLISENSQDSEFRLTDCALQRRPAWEFEQSTAQTLLCRQFGTQDLTAFGVRHLPLAIGAAGCLLQYLQYTQRSALAAFANYASGASSILCAYWMQPPAAIWN